jgi:hypothetical protein
MLKRHIHDSKSAIGKRFLLAKRALESSGSLFLLKSRAVVFLCGANQREGVPSARRADIARFFGTTLPDARVIYAEGVFREFEKHGGKKNALDIEHEISRLADQIIIVLESESAFCELGAFAHHTLRKKLIVINDARFRLSKSFINVGPLRAIEEDVSARNVLWYPMSPNGVTRGDGVGTTFHSLAALLKTNRLGKKSVPLVECHPRSSSKESLLFAHDLIYLFGPLTYDELIEIYSVIFGRSSFDNCRHLLGILKEARFVDTVNGPFGWAYRSLERKEFFLYPFPTSNIVAAFRGFHYRSEPGRLARG